MIFWGSGNLLFFHLKISTVVKFWQKVIYERPLVWTEFTVSIRKHKCCVGEIYPQESGNSQVTDIGIYISILPFYYILLKKIDLVTMLLLLLTIVCCQYALSIEKIQSFVKLSNEDYDFPILGFGEFFNYKEYHKC